MAWQITEAKRFVSVVLLDYNADQVHIFKVPNTEDVSDEVEQWCEKHEIDISDTEWMSTRNLNIEFH